MLFGEQPYRDFFQFTPPGANLVYLALFKFFGQRIWVTNFTVLWLGAALCCICFSISRHLMALPSAFLATLLFLVLVYGKLLNATHHWFSVLIILCAVRVAFNGMNSVRLVSIGVLLGAAAFFTQAHAAAAVLAFALLLALESWSTPHPMPSLAQRLALLLVGFI